MDFLHQLGHLGFTARIKRLNERIVASTVAHYSQLHYEIEPNWHVIFLLLKQKEALTVTEISQNLGFSHPAMIKITRKMQERGFLEFYKHPTDGRKTLIRLSKTGLLMLPKFEAEWLRIEQILKEVVADSFLEQLHQLESALVDKGFEERYADKFEKVHANSDFEIRTACPSEFKNIGELMVQVYSGLDGFPKADEQPTYYESLRNIGEFTKNPGAELLVAVSPTGALYGAVLYFADIAYYGAGGTITEQKNASGFRLLAVDPAARGLGVGSQLSQACIDRAISHGHEQLLIHSTSYMKPAQRIYKKLGFKPAPELNFEQNGLEVFGFRLRLK
nr:bifunctional helix-turn-helix transcriptional regulator/GNAT family N-acetyltransferase [Allomuricauda sp.]